MKKTNTKKIHHHSTLEIKFNFLGSSSKIFQTEIKVFKSESKIAGDYLQWRLKKQIIQN